MELVQVHFQWRLLLVSSLNLRVLIPEGCSLIQNSVGIYTDAISVSFLQLSQKFKLRYLGL
jgi:hypothetical protein